MSTALAGIAARRPGHLRGARSGRCHPRATGAEALLGVYMSMTPRDNRSPGELACPGMGD